MGNWFKRSGPAAQDLVVRRIAQLNVEITRLQQIVDDMNENPDGLDTYQSVRRLRGAMAQEELGTKRAELALLASRLDQLAGRYAEVGAAPLPAGPGLAVAATASRTGGTTGAEVPARPGGARSRSVVSGGRWRVAVGALVVALGLSVVLLDAVLAPSPAPSVSVEPTPVRSLPSVSLDQRPILGPVWVDLAPATDGAEDAAELSVDDDLECEDCAEATAGDEPATPTSAHAPER